VTERLREEKIGRQGETCQGLENLAESVKEKGRKAKNMGDVAKNGGQRAEERIQNKSSPREIVAEPLLRSSI